MGYAVTQNSLNRSIIQRLPLAHMTWIRTNSTSGETVLSKNIDLTGISYVTLTVKSTVDAGQTGTINVDHSGNSLFSPTLNAGTEYRNIENPVPAGSQQEGTLEITITSSDAGHYVILDNLIINTSGA